MFNFFTTIVNMLYDIRNNLFDGSKFKRDRKITISDAILVETINAKKEIRLKQIESNASITLSKLEVEKEAIAQQMMRQKNLQLIIQLKQEALTFARELVGSANNVSDNLITTVLVSSDIDLHTDIENITDHMTDT